jgi:hypothetical protein
MPRQATKPVKTQLCNPRHLRAHLRDYLNTNNPTLIGDHRKVRAILIPIPPYDRWQQPQRTNALAQARRAARTALNDLLHQKQHLIHKNAPP